MKEIRIEDRSQEFAVPVDRVEEAQEKGGVTIPIYEHGASTVDGGASKPADLQGAERHFSEPIPTTSPTEVEDGIENEDDTAPLTAREKVLAWGALLMITAVLSVAGGVDRDAENQQIKNNPANKIQTK